MKVLRRTAIVAVALSVLGLSGVTIASPAQAVSFGDITCTHSVQYPHASTHVNGTINVVAGVTCTSTMSRIYIRTWLHKSGGSTWPGAPRDWLVTSSVSANAATDCSNGPGTFYGSSTTELYPPAGYTPTYATLTNTGASVWVKCGSGISIAPDARALTELAAAGYELTHTPDGVVASKDLVFEKSAD